MSPSANKLALSLSTNTMPGVIVPIKNRENKVTVYPTLSTVKRNDVQYK
jgi:hypothetical protein